MSLASGTRLGPYEITGPIGAGGMGEVYRAHDSRLHREVAIKTLPPAFAEEASRLARFQREAQALAALSHPNIAAIYGLEESGGTIALVMELINGPTLAERIAAGPIPVAEALAIARQISAALEAAHEKGIVHRDLKPANIKLTEEGQVKVLDFGLAKAMDTEATSPSGSTPANSPTLTLESTRAGAIMGTAAYMSPEQARGKSVDRRADIWAFGVVFFEMLTGRSTFEGETVSDTLAGVLRADVDWNLLPASTPPAIRRLLERCLQKDPKRRLRDMGDAWIEIDSPMEPAPAVAAQAAPAAGSNRRPWVACAATALIAVAAIAWGVLRKPAVTPQPVVRWSHSQEKEMAAFSLSHDGSRLVYMDISGNSYTLMSRTMDQLDPKPIPDLNNSALPAFSPDGQWIAFISVANGNKLQKAPVTGGTAITLCDYPGDGFGLSWGDDGNIVFSGPKGLMRVSSSGGTSEQITTLDPNKHEVAHGWPSILPGSHAVLFSIRGSSSSQIAVLDLQKHTTRVLVQNGSTPRYAASGHLIYYRTGTLFAAPFSLSRLEVTGPEAPVVEHVAVINGDGADYTISDGGMLVYMTGASVSTGGKTILNWADRKGTLQPLSDAQDWGTGRLSPDMTHVANGIRSGDQEDIWTYDLVRRTPTRLTFEGKNSFPIWSPDGRWITFVGNNQGKTALYRVASDASGKPELLVDAEPNAVPNSWSPDGKTLVFTQPTPDHKPHLWSVTAPGGKAARLHEGDSAESNGEVSPDGRWLAYESSESGSGEVYVQPFPGPGPKSRISTQGGAAPRWAHNGKELFFWNFSGDRQLFVVDVQTGAAFHAGLAQALFKAPAGTTWDVVADGKRFLVETPATATGGRYMEAVVNWFDELNRRVPVKK
jgi:eukaryotic-like serine/threonine-protein kinase